MVGLGRTDGILVTGYEVCLLVLFGIRPVRPFVPSGALFDKYDLHTHAHTHCREDDCVNSDNTYHNHTTMQAKRQQTSRRRHTCKGQKIKRYSKRHNFHIAIMKARSKHT